MGSYLGAIALFILNYVSVFLLEKYEWLAKAYSWVQPFGSNALQNATAYWTVFQSNTKLPELEGALSINRLICIASGIACMLLASGRMVFYTASFLPARKQAKKTELSKPVPSTLASPNLDCEVTGRRLLQKKA